ncbi:MAG: serine/threonine-protein phosphatase [Acidobacteriota bacterium]|nr:serine/threonine-protein phosphatase [Acidobacteriota bacterium]
MRVHRKPSCVVRPLRLVPCILLLLFALPATAQQEIVAVTNWRVHAGDNPAWAAPDFDDSQWATIGFRQLNEPEASNTGTHWYRATFQVPPDFAGQELAVGMGPLDEVYDVYIDGARVGRLGHWEPDPRGPFPRHLTFPIPPGLLKGPVGHIAIRRWKGGAGLFWVTFGMSGYMSHEHAPEIGSKALIEERERLHPAAGAIGELPWGLDYLLFLFAAAISFVLYSVQRRRLEYFYLGVYCALWGVPPLIAIPLATSDSVMGPSWGPGLVFFLATMSDAFQLLFLATLCPRYRKILKLGASLSVITASTAAYGLAAQSYAAMLIWRDWVNFGTWPFILIAAWGFLKDRSRGSFAIAFCLLLSAAGWAWGTVALRFHLPGLVFTAGPFQVDVRSVPLVIFIFVTLLVLYLRYRDEQARQAAMDQDLAAARRMQQQLLAAHTENPPGFTVDAVYRPAREVGGDFYRTVPLEDGSLLVIVGDVSGKGLDAAMLVALILGSLANETHRNPAALLAYLNQAVLGRTNGGFITACCARFHPSGSVLLANAGHIPPYLDGRELPLENGLPLGISPHAAYAEAEIQASSALTFLSDGVVEARNAQGELLGFDRMAALTVKPAAAIAQAAQQWGQEDDITVLTVAPTFSLNEVTA